MSIEGCQAELTAHAPTAVGARIMTPDSQRATSAALPGLLRTNNYQHLAEARDQRVIATFYEKAACAGIMCINPMARRFGPVLTNPIGTQ